MIHQFFGLREQPFGVTPDPRYLYLGRGHREALASLYYGVEANRGFLALIANPGMGKTTLLFHLLEKFRHSDRTAFLFQTQCSSRELMRFLLAELGIEPEENDLWRMHEQFNRYLLEQSSAGRRVIIVIDEAQNLDPAVMETVRLLSNFETPKAKLLQIIMAGQPQLATKLASPSLSQLRQRIASFNGLEPLTPPEVARFIDHRLHIARYEGSSLFTDDAKLLIADVSEGIPRNINSLCFGALSLACALRQKSISSEMVQEVFGDLDLQRLLPQPKHSTARLQRKIWPSPAVNPKPAPVSQSLARADTTPTSAAAVASPPLDAGSNRHNSSPEIRNGLPSYAAKSKNEDGDKEPKRKLELKRFAISALPRVMAFAAIVLIVGNGVTKVVTPAGFAGNLIAPITEKIASGNDVTPPDNQLPKVAAAAKQLQPPATESQTVASKKSSSGGVEPVAPATAVSKSSLTNRPHVGFSPNVDTRTTRASLANTRPEQIQTPSENPAELWELVKEGSTSAEIKLASLYFEGNVVEQDCKQAHLLLVVASRKGSKIAASLLNNEYAERCHE
jgi:type II secretory pathway predicted ATPase ExeA